ncbi:pectate lyase [Sphingobacterium sp. N143]|uniref:pectate lyase family protein n=1 Tax=Sphingobacterium sp. N143 TaxID=2746727 RepID=UPI0025786062|nr:pectate lyase [Sphingobacterium sp. N143]MDM1292709.1 pectate lyase [Sphingobacterium sp. N143]
MKKLVLFGILYFMACGARLNAQETAAFPGAEGGGMYTKGGRGGQVYYVNTLADNERGDPNLQEGSLRWCLQQDGAKTILFKVGGTIWLQQRLSINKGDLTIAGQTAPGGGITLAGSPVSVDADNVIIRFLRFRMGDLQLSAQEADGADAFGGRQRQHIVIDHCSISWSTDECASFYDNKNFTMQWCIVSESLRLSGHSKGPHGYGAIWGGVQASFHHNLLAHHDSRTPRLGPGARYAGHDTTDIRNNVIYNWNGNGAYGGEAMCVNIVNNFYKPGPATGKTIRNRIVALNAKTEERPFPTIKNVWGKYFVTGNLLPHHRRISADNWLGVRIVGEQTESRIRLNREIPVQGTIRTHDAQTAYAKVLAYAGSSYVRDAIDERIIAETNTGTASYQGKNPHNGEGGKWKSIQYPRKGIVDSQQDTNPDPAHPHGAWPVLAAGIAGRDSDRDGIPDGWLEKCYPGKRANELNEAGYTYLEEYLNELVAPITAGQR